MQPNIRITDGKLAGFSVPVSFFPEGDQIVADCPSLGLAAHGRTEAAAATAMRGVIEVFLEEVIEMGTLDRVLEERGWTTPGAHSSDPRAVQWTPPKVTTSNVEFASASR